MLELPSKISEIVLRLESKLFEFSRHLFGRSSGHMASMSVTDTDVLIQFVHTAFKA